MQRKILYQNQYNDANELGYRTNQLLQGLINTTTSNYKKLGVTDHVTPALRVLNGTETLKEC